MGCGQMAAWYKHIGSKNPTPAFTTTGTLVYQFEEIPVPRDMSIRGGRGRFGTPSVEILN
jgi:hypothetical protein